MLDHIEYFALFRLALLADGLVLRNTVLVKVATTDPALGHIVRRWTRRFLYKRQKGQISKANNKEELLVNLF